MTVAIALRLFLAILFARAAWHKWSQADSFRAELSAYQLLPPLFIPSVAHLLAAMEIFCGAGLFFTHYAVMLAIVLLLLYATAMAINLWRGHHQIDCGCGGWLSPRKNLAWTLVWRNLVLALLAFIGLLLPIPATLPPGEVISILLMAFTFWLLYEGLEQAISNSQHYQQWKKS